MEEFKTIISYKDNILSYSKDNVLKVIHVLEKFIPPDDYILTYSDFLRKKDFVRYTGFNINLYNALVNLTHDIWDTDKKINRLSLLTILKRYNKKNPDLENVPSETASKLFEIFRQVVFYQNIKKNIKTFDKMKKLVNSIMLGIKLKDEELSWLCDKAETSELILNRVLRYRHKSPVITNWVKENFHADYLRLRRSELVSWLLDEDPSYEISSEILLEDFEHVNNLDVKILDKYEADTLDYNLKEDLKKTFREPDPIDPFFPFGNPFDISTQNHQPESPYLIFTNRYYDDFLGIDWGELHKFKKAKNFDQYREIFLTHINRIIKNVMIWGICYSRLNNKTKTEILKKYYTSDFNYAFFRMAVKDRNLDLLKWLHENGK